MSDQMMEAREKLEELVAALIDERLDADGCLELRGLLESSADFRRYYREQMNIHAQMKWLLRSPEGGGEVSFEEERSIGRKKVLGLKLSRVAAISIFLIISAVVLTSRFHLDKSEMQGEVVSTTLTQASGARWEIGSLVPELGRELENKTYSLVEGFLRLDMGQGVKVFVEAPCRFEPVSNMLLRVHSGRVNVEVTEKEGHGFTIWTPVGEFVDLGTRFGVGVGRDQLSNAVVMSEVFKGEVKLRPHRGADTETEILIEGDVRGLVGVGDRVEVSEEIDNRPIDLSFSRYGETEDIERYKRQDAYNLALGRPVGGGHYYNSAQGEVFPLQNITDGRVNDTGIPGDWSFWINPNESPTTGFVIDLGESKEIDCIQLLNTRNRQYGDRGTRDFRVSVADESKAFQKLGYGKLSRIKQELSADSSPPVETFVFAPMEARYVKVEIISFYATPNYTGSAGLNEMRVFGSSTPRNVRSELTVDARLLSEDPPQGKNIALGAAMESSGSYGDIFPATRVVDGVISDGALERGSYSCWLSPEKKRGASYFGSR